jgi:hypothetical protein
LIGSGLGIATNGTFGLFTEPKLEPNRSHANWV